MTKLGPAQVARHRDYSNPDKGETCVMFARSELSLRVFKLILCYLSKLQSMEIYTESLNFVDDGLITFKTVLRSHS